MERLQASQRDPAQRRPASAPEVDLEPRLEGRDGEGLTGLAGAVHGSPVMVAQRAALARAFGPAADLRPLPTPAPGAVAQRTIWRWNGTTWIAQKNSGEASPQPATAGTWKGEEVNTTPDRIGANKAKVKTVKKAEKANAALTMTPVERLIETKKSNEHQYIRELFGAMVVAGWTFPSQTNGDGIMGKNTISASRLVASGGTHQIAMHINFMISCGTLSKTGDAAIRLKLLHVTARSEGNQIAIVEDGPSMLTAAKSIHCGPGNDWDWNHKNVAELVADLGGAATLGTVQGALNPFGMAYIAGWRANMTGAMTLAAAGKGVTPDYTGSDATWK